MLMKLRQRFLHWLRESDDWAGEQVKPARNLKNSVASSKYIALTAMHDDIGLQSEGMYFKLMPGCGGIAIEVRRFDEKIDSDISILHIIPDNLNLSEELAKIITLESLKR